MLLKMNCCPDQNRQRHKFRHLRGGSEAGVGKNRVSFATDWRMDFRATAAPVG